MRPMTNKLLVNIYIQKYFSFISTCDLKQTNNILGCEASLCWKITRVSALIWSYWRLRDLEFKKICKMQRVYVVLFLYENCNYTMQFIHWQRKVWVFIKPWAWEFISLGFTWKHSSFIGKYTNLISLLLNTKDYELCKCLKLREWKIQAFEKSDLRESTSENYPQDVLFCICYYWRISVY